MNEYRDLGLARGTGAVSNEYKLHGRAAYEAWARAVGEHEVADWNSLVWAEQYAWCEAARAARAA